MDDRHIFGSKTFLSRSHKNSGNNIGLLKSHKKLYPSLYEIQTKLIFVSQKFNYISLSQVENSTYKIIYWKCNKNLYLGIITFHNLNYLATMRKIEGIRKVCKSTMYKFTTKFRWKSLKVITIGETPDFCILCMHNNQNWFFILKRLWVVYFTL